MQSALSLNDVCLVCNTVSFVFERMLTICFKVNIEYFPECFSSILFCA